MGAEKERIGSLVGGISSVADFLSQTMEAFADQPLVEATSIEDLSDGGK